ncbi:MAG: gamma-glutamyl-gamma-aminobutyrate hydrolase family protein [Gemmatimonas sp.]|nr:gamma-glutamyl-gamma-aminobutyrate hydrolase family protein [Gemmatimonas sp.]
MVRPLVALTTTIDAKGGDYGQPRVAAYANYLLTLQLAGLTPVLVTPAHDTKAISQLIDGCAGLVLSGGDDIDPSRYGRDPIPELGPVNPPRDVAECRAIAAAVGRDLPILGICRGHQMLNVYFGGSLCQDIATEFRDAVSHDQMTPWGAHHHEVTVHPDSRLAKALGGNRFEINSYHHQAILDVADGLDVTARADDGLIEAVESRHHRWIVGVQWHPERHEARADDGDPNVRLLRAFAAAVTAYAREG